MSKENKGKKKNDKTPAVTTAKEKRAAKILKRNLRRNSE
jgi:hypothetical protein